MTVPNRLFSLAPGALVELFQLDTSPCHTLNGVQVAAGTVYCWTPGTINEGPVSFGGQVYVSIPIEGVDWQWNGIGTIPQPKLRVNNFSGVATGLVISLDDLVGAKVTRIRTFAQHLDGQSAADPSSMFEPDVFFINRKSSHDNEMIEFELATSYDQIGLQIPARQIIRDICGFTYRQYVNGAFVMGSCPYAGAQYFAEDDSAANSPALDVCSHHMNGCLVRFGQNADLPMEAFPGAGISTGV